MILKLDREKLEGILSDYTKITGISIAILDTDAENIACAHGAGCEFCRMLQQADDCYRCKLSDDMILERCRRTGKPEMHVCHAGLCDMAIPLISEGKIIAYVILGRIRKSVEFDSVLESIPWFSGDKGALEKAFSELCFYDEETLKSVANIAVAVSAYILGDGVISPRYNVVAEKAAEIIEASLSDRITVGGLCRSLGVSKNYLYESFKTAFGCTVKDYITDKRVSKAEKLLAETDLSIGEIADRVGIFNHTYFSRLMTERTGMSPIKYRKTKACTKV